MSKDAFITKNLDEMVGLLLAAFGQANKEKASIPGLAEDGKFMMGQMRRAKEFLGRMWDEMHKEAK